MNKGNELLYKRSILIAENFYNLINTGFFKTDGYIYPSIAFGAGHNVAIKPDAVDRELEFTGLLICKYHGKQADNSLKIEIMPMWSDLIENDMIQYKTGDISPDLLNSFGSKYYSN